MAVDLEALGITKEDIVDRMAEKLIEEIVDTSDLHELMRNCINSHVTREIETRLAATVDKALADTMASILETEVTPRTIWGDKCGNPTTIRAALSEKARVYWTEKVNASGVAERYGGRPRAEILMEQCVGAEFTKAVTANIDSIILGFKDALQINAQAQIAEHINKLIVAKKR